MRKSILTFCMALSIASTHAQMVEGLPPDKDVGFNMPNAVENITTVYDSMYLYDLIPAGGSFGWRDRYDKHNEDPARIISIYNWLNENDRGFHDVFVGTDSIGFDNAAAIAKLKAAGVQVPVAEFVNEAFYKAGGYSFDWPKYQAKLLEFIAAVRSVDPNIRIGIPIAPKPSDVFTQLQGGSNLHKSWNDQAFAFMNAHPEWSFCKIIHIYYTGVFVPELGAVASDETGISDKIKAPTRRLYDYRIDTTDETYWRNIFSQSIPEVFWEPMLNYLSTHAPAATTRVTECGYIGAGKLNGSWVVAAKAFELANKYGSDPRIDGLYWHGGLTASRVGAWSPRNSSDVRDPENPNMVSTPTADAFQMYFHAAGNIYRYRPEFQISSTGTYSFWYLNGGPEFKPVINVTQGLKYTYQVQFISAKRFSSIGTTMDFTKNGSLIGPDEVSGISIGDNCPALSFGYVVVTVEPIIIGCMDPNATNYNPDAEVDSSPSACVYPPPPTTCYKKRWLFSGCKIDRTCKVNNCNPGSSNSRSSFSSSSNSK